jgi:hypothetical protein
MRRCTKTIWFKFSPLYDTPYDFFGKLDEAGRTFISFYSICRNSESWWSADMNYELIKKRMIIFLKMTPLDCRYSHLKKFLRFFNASFGFRRYISTEKIISLIWEKTAENEDVCMLDFLMTNDIKISYIGDILTYVNEHRMSVFLECFTKNFKSFLGFYSEYEVKDHIMVVWKVAVDFANLRMAKFLMSNYKKYIKRNIIITNVLYTLLYHHNTGGLEFLKWLNENFTISSVAFRVEKRYLFSKDIQMKFMWWKERFGYYPEIVFWLMDTYGLTFNDIFCDSSY